MCLFFFFFLWFINQIGTIVLKRSWCSRQHGIANKSSPSKCDMHLLSTFVHSLTGSLCHSRNVMRFDYYLHNDRCRFECCLSHIIFAHYFFTSLAILSIIRRVGGIKNKNKCSGFFTITDHYNKSGCNEINFFRAHRPHHFWLVL